MRIEIRLLLSQERIIAMLFSRCMVFKIGTRIKYFPHQMFIPKSVAHL